MDDLRVKGGACIAARIGLKCASRASYKTEYSPFGVTDALHLSKASTPYWKSKKPRMNRPRTPDHRPRPAKPLATPRIRRTTDGIPLREQSALLEVQQGE